MTMFRFFKPSDCMAFMLTSFALQALAHAPNTDDLAACQSGANHGNTLATEIPFQTLSEKSDSWNGYTVTTVTFKNKSVGYASKGREQGIAFNGRVYPIKDAKLINLSQEDFNAQLERDSIGILQPADWYWLTGRQQFLCIATNKSMERATPILFLLSMDRFKRVYVAAGTPSRAICRFSMILRNGCLADQRHSQLQ